MGLLRRRQVPDERTQARAEREAAERRLDHATEHVIIPLREMRERNHVSEIIEALIRRRVQRGDGG